jgi:hypothetical protein
MSLLPYLILYLHPFDQRYQLVFCLRCIFFPPGSGSFKQHKETDLDGEGQKTNLNFVPKEYVGKGNPGVRKLC